MKALFYFIGFCLIFGTSCSSKSISTSMVSEEEALKKIQFELEEIDENGLIGPADGKRSVAYEFCIPFNKAQRMEVLRIDKSVRFFNGPSGKVGCDKDQYLCLGEGANRKVLIKLASLP